MKRIALVSLTLPVLVWELLMEHFKGAQIRYCFLILSSEKYWLTYTALMQCYERNLSLNCSMMDFETELTFQIYRWIKLYLRLLKLSRYQSDFAVWLVENSHSQLDSFFAGKISSSQTQALREIRLNSDQNLSVFTSLCLRYKITEFELPVVEAIVCLIVVAMVKVAF